MNKNKAFLLSRANFDTVTLKKSLFCSRYFLFFWSALGILRSAVGEHWWTYMCPFNLPDISKPPGHKKQQQKNQHVRYNAFRTTGKVNDYFHVSALTGARGYLCHTFLGLGRSTWNRKRPWYAHNPFCRDRQTDKLLRAESRQTEGWVTYLALLRAFTKFHGLWKKL